MISMKKHVTDIRFLTHAASIAALYFTVSYLIAPIASGLFQCRISEALTVLPFFTPAAIPGLTVGCLLFNALSGAPAPDVVFGSLATLLAAIATWGVKKLQLPKWLAPLPSVIANGLIVGAILTYVYEVGVPYPVAAAYVAAGQLLACYALGYPLLLLTERYESKLF